MDIITHPGKAHTDEFLASCLLMADKYYCLERREPTPEEKNNPYIFVLDIGREYDPSRRNFDHHQFPRGTNPTCTYTLVWEYILSTEIPDVDMLTLRKIFPQIEYIEILDSKGPNYLNKSFGLTKEASIASINPIATGIIKMFETTEIIRPSDPLSIIMSTIGQTLKKQVKTYHKNMKLLEELGDIKSINGLNYLDLTRLPKNDYPVRDHVESLSKTVAFILYNDLRNDGFTLVRTEEGESLLDFSKCEGMNGVTFAHKNGFLLAVERFMTVEMLTKFVNQSINEG